MSMFVITKKNLIVFVIIISLCCTLVFGYSFHKQNLNHLSKNPYTVVLDAGHGGIDGGAVGGVTGVKESDLNLCIAKDLKYYLETAGFTVILTRESQDGLYGDATPGYKRRDMKKRKEIIEASQPSLMLSLHLNKFNNRIRRGAQVFYRDQDDQSRELANRIQNQFNIEVNERAYSPLSGDFYMLKCSKYTSVLVESGFLSNPEDERNLITPEYRKKVAYLIYCGIVSYLGSTKTTLSIPVVKMSR